MVLVFPLCCPSSPTITLSQKGHEVQTAGTPFRSRISGAVHGVSPARIRGHSAHPTRLAFVMAANVSRKHYTKSSTLAARARKLMSATSLDVCVLCLATASIHRPFKELPINRLRSWLTESRTTCTRGLLASYHPPDHQTAYVDGRIVENGFRRSISEWRWTEVSNSDEAITATSVSVLNSLVLLEWRQRTCFRRRKDQSYSHGKADS